MPPVIHMSAGTNGKGSVIAIICARSLEARRAVSVHVYTSPHLVRFHERIRLAGELIEENALLTLLEECERANGDGSPITFFEITTCAAFSWPISPARRPTSLPAGDGPRRPARFDQCRR